MSEFVWSPAIYNPAYPVEPLRYVPRPIIDCDIPLEWAFDQHKIPLAHGDKTFGASENGLRITITGGIGLAGYAGDESLPSAPNLKLGELAMWSEIEAFRSCLTTGGPDQKLEFFLYMDLDTASYRKFKNVRPVTFAVKLGDNERTMFGYTLVLHAEDPTIYLTGPGA